MAKGDLESLKAQVEQLIKSAKLTQDQQKAYKQMAADISAGGNSLNQWKVLLSDIKGSVDEVADSLDYVGQSFKDSINELQKQNVAISLQKSALNKLSGIARNLSEIRKGETTYTDKQLEGYAKQINQKLKDLALAKELSKGDKKKTAEIENQIQESSKLSKAYDEILGVNKGINKSLGITPKILGGIDKSLQKLGFDGLGVSHALDETKRLGQEAAALGKPFSAAGTFTKQLAGNLSATFSKANLIQGVFAMLTSAMISVDKLTGQLAKNIGVSYNESLKFQKQFNQVAIDSDHLQVNSKNLNESFNSLNQEFGGATSFSNQMLNSFTALTKQAGFTSKTIAQISKLTGSQGIELENNVALMQGELAAMNALNGTTFSEQQMLEEIGSISKGTLLTLNQYPGQLGKALYTSKKLALSFADMESISGSLLDFEGSIQSELEAELLTGKNLNLEKARQLALDNDIAGAAEEVAKQVGSAAEFGKMNRIQQEALAKAVGLSRDELSKSLIEREALQKIGMADNDAAKKKYATLRQTMSAEEAAKALGDERLGAQYESESVQERFAASVEQLKTIFVDIGTAIMPIASFIADAVSGTAKLIKQYSGLFKVLGSIYLLYKSISITQGIIDKFGKLNLANLQYELGFRRLLVAEWFKENVQSKLRNAYELIYKQFTREGIIVKGAILAKDLAILAATEANNALTAIGLGFNSENLIVKGLIFLKEQGLNVLKTIGNALGFTSLSTTVAEGAAETVVTAAKGTQATLMGGIIAQGLVYLGTLIAQAAAALTTVSAVTVGFGTIAALAAAAVGIAWLYSKTRPKKAGDMMGLADGKTQVSPAEGGLFELSPNDDFIAAPGAADAMPKKGDKGRVSESTEKGNQALMAGINQLISINKQILAKDITIMLEGEKVGAGVVEAEREIQ